ncbi:unnamed protein product [Arctia plantaginis]|uniref:Uncharacterized protein n=1 Tax=Arctia plantaginis TaxID=874455 RepID=A0A8S0YSD6_ARCPL|nr:unnamed protein product [Arctia plantaginis]
MVEGKAYKYRSGALAALGVRVDDGRGARRASNDVAAPLRALLRRHDRSAPAQPHGRAAGFAAATTHVTRARTLARRDLVARAYV